jgi:hypothetical protein
MSTIRWNRLIPLLLIPIFLCVSLVAFGPSLRRAIQANLWKDDPVQAAELAHSLVDYTLPAGYRENSFFQILEASNVLISPADGSAAMTILLGQEEISMRDQEFVIAMEPAWAREVGRQTYTTERVRAEPAVLLGQPTTLSYREGTDAAGAPVRQLITVVYGKKGWVVAGDRQPAGAMGPGPGGCLPGLTPIAEQLNRDERDI